MKNLDITTIAFNSINKGHDIILKEEKDKRKLKTITKGSMGSIIILLRGETKDKILK